MTIRAFEGAQPRIDPRAWVSEAAYVVGDVEIGETSSVWPGAVIRADFAPIRIGANSHIEDNCVMHTGELLTVEDNVIVGHGAVIHCRRVGSNCLIGNHATLLDGAEIGDFSIVAAGALVLGATVIPEGSFVAGVPAVVRPARADQLERMHAMSSRDGGYAQLQRRYREAGL